MLAHHWQLRSKCFHFRNCMHASSIRQSMKLQMVW